MGGQVLKTVQSSADVFPCGCRVFY